MLSSHLALLAVSDQPRTWRHAGADGSAGHATLTSLSQSPFHFHTGPALGGILAVLTAALDMKSTIGGKQHSLLYFLAAAMQPRMLMTVDEDGAGVDSWARFLYRSFVNVSW